MHYTGQNMVITCDNQGNISLTRWHLGQRLNNEMESATWRARKERAADSMHKGPRLKNILGPKKKKNPRAETPEQKRSRKWGWREEQNPNTWGLTDVVRSVGFILSVKWETTGGMTWSAGPSKMQSFIFQWNIYRMIWYVTAGRLDMEVETKAKIKKYTGC